MSTCCYGCHEVDEEVEETGCCDYDCEARGYECIEKQQQEGNSCCIPSDASYCVIDSILNSSKPTK